MAIYIIHYLASLFHHGVKYKNDVHVDWKYWDRNIYRSIWWCSSNDIYAIKYCIYFFSLWLSSDNKSCLHRLCVYGPIFIDDVHLDGKYRAYYKVDCIEEMYSHMTVVFFFGLHMSVGLMSVVKKNPHLLLWRHTPAEPDSN